MKPRVYIETTIPSFYYEVRQEADMVARKEWTRQWWDEHTQQYQLFTSIPVLEELYKGDHPKKNETIELLNSLPLLPVEDEIIDIVKEYIDRFVMPQNPVGDALHLALASYHHCHFILTWNCRHLANANKFESIRHLNTMLGLFVPSIVTPLELININEEA